MIIMSFWHNLSKLSGHTSCNNNNISSSRSMLDSGVISKSWLASSGGRLIWYTVIILYGSCSKQLVPHTRRERDVQFHSHLKKVGEIIEIRLEGTQLPLCSKSYLYRVSLTKFALLFYNSLKLEAPWLGTWLTFWLLLEYLVVVDTDLMWSNLFMRI